VPDNILTLAAKEVKHSLKHLLKPGFCQILDSFVTQGQQSANKEAYAALINRINMIMTDVFY